MSEERQDPNVEEKRSAAEEAADQGVPFPDPPASDPPETPPKDPYPVEGD